MNDIIIQKRSELSPDFESLANISNWSKAWWIFAWEALDGWYFESNDLTERNNWRDDINEVWGFVVRLTLKSKMAPTDVTNVILEIFDRG